MSETPTESELRQMRAEKTATKKRFFRELGDAKHRFAPSNLRDEIVDNIVDTALEYGDQGLQIAKRNKGKLAIAATAAAAFLARRPLLSFAKSSSQKAKSWWQSYAREK